MSIDIILIFYYICIKQGVKNMSDWLIVVLIYLACCLTVMFCFFIYGVINPKKAAQELENDDGTYLAMIVFSPLVVMLGLIMLPILLVYGIYYLLMRGGIKLGERRENKRKLDNKTYQIVTKYKNNPSKLAEELEKLIK